jgi:beta-lactamase class A
VTRLALRCGAALISAAVALSPGRGSADEICDLSQAADPQLQGQLEKLLRDQGLTAPVREDKLAVTLLVLTDPEHPRLAQVNGHHMLYAASLPKIAILLGVAAALDEGRLKLDRALQEDVHDMIRHSCNACANRVLDVVGENYVVEILQSPRFGFYDRDEDGGLWLGKAYGPEPAFRRDPLNGLSHGATSFQAARFYCGLHRGTLASPMATRLMLDALANPGIAHKFVSGLQDYEDIEIYRKSGTWRAWHADSALVRDGDNVYVIVGLADDSSGGAWLERLAAPLHELATAP